MKALIICLALIQGLEAAELAKYSGERLEYDLEWNPFWGIITPKAGEASFSFDSVAAGWQAAFKVQTVDWARKLFVYDNRVVADFDSTGILRQARTYVTDSTVICWTVTASQTYVEFEVNDTLYDRLNLAGKLPLEALSAFYHFRGMDLQLGQVSTLEVFGYDTTGVCWSAATIKVKDQALLKWHGRKYLCWKVEIRMREQDNFIPSGLVTVWVTCNSNCLPLRVVTDFRYKGIKCPVIGILKARSQPSKKDEP